MGAVGAVAVIAHGFHVTKIPKLRFHNKKGGVVDLSLKRQVHTYFVP